MSEVEKVLREYYEKFGSNYPLGIVSTLTDNQIIERVRKCIDTGKPEKPIEYEEDTDY